MDHEIDEGVDLPPARRGPPPKYPFADLKVGQSFATKVPRERVGPAAAMYARRNGGKFAVRKDGETLRVWRTE